MRDAAHMPELEQDLSAGLVHGVSYSSPRLHLLGGVDARRADVTDTLRTDLGGLGHDQSGACALRVIRRGEWVGYVAGKRPAARHRRHHHAVGKFEAAK